MRETSSHEKLSERVSGFDDFIALVQEGVLSSRTSQVCSWWTLYDHQEQTTRRLADGQHTIVASSTGSDKTESFLIPIIDYCLSHKLTMVIPKAKTEIISV